MALWRKECILQITFEVPLLSHCCTHRGAKRIRHLAVNESCVMTSVECDNVASKIFKWSDKWSTKWAADSTGSKRDMLCRDTLDIVDRAHKYKRTYGLDIQIPDNWHVQSMLLSDQSLWLGMSDTNLSHVVVLDPADGHVQTILARHQSQVR